MPAPMLAALLLATTLTSEPKFLIGVQAWTFNKVTLYEAIEKAAQAGAKYIEMFPGQTLRTGSDLKVGPGLPESENEELLKHMDKSGVRPVAFGVTGVPADKEQARTLFRWAKRLGLVVVNTESVEALDTIEAMVKEFDIKVGFHNHPKQTGNPSYRMWDPAYIYSIVKDRDARIGSCADTGHWVRSGIKPVDAIRALRGRIVSSHLKDLHEFAPSGHDVPFGMGVSDIPAILNAFTRMGFTGPVSVEYEYNWDHSVVDVANCLGFVRGYGRR